MLTCGVCAKALEMKVEREFNQTWNKKVSKMLLIIIEDNIATFVVQFSSLLPFRVIIFVLRLRLLHSR